MSGQLVGDALADDVDFVHPFPAPVFIKVVVAEGVKSSEVGQGLKSQRESKRGFVTQVRIFVVIDRIPEGKIETCVQPGEGFGPDH